jgi:Protein of unknown function (DUF664)
MTNLDEHGRPEPPLAADETATLLGFLDYQRATLAWKCAGLDAAGLRATVGATSMTLGGLLKHLAYIEDDWFSRWLHGRDRQPPWDTVDWKADPDWEWHSAAEVGGRAHRGIAAGPTTPFPRALAFVLGCVPRPELPIYDAQDVPALLPEVCCAARRDHLSRQDEERQAAGNAWQEFGLVFTNTIHPVHPPGPFAPTQPQRDYGASRSRPDERTLRNVE